MPTELNGIILPVHPDYTAYVPLWQKCRDTIAGEEAIKADTSNDYLPRPAGLSDGSLYLLYKQQANWFGATGRAAAGLLGTIIRKPPQLIGITPDELKQLGRTKKGDIVGIGKSGEDLDALVRESIKQTIHVGRVGIMIDAQGEDSGGSPPYIVLYQAEDILFWAMSTSQMTGRDVLTVVIVHELHTEFNANTMKYESTSWYRMLYLDNGVYKQQMFVASGSQDPSGISVERVGGPIVPTKRTGKHLDEIPFFFQGTDSAKPSPDQPILLALANLNLSHYQLGATFYWGLHWAGLPTPYLKSDNSDGAEGITIGSSKLLIIPREDELAVMEIVGHGLNAIAAELKKKESQMSILGSRLLEDSKGNTDVAESMKLKMAGDSAMLGAITLTASEVWTDVLQNYLQWVNYQEDPALVSVKVNTDFNMRRMDSQEVIMLVQAFKEDSLSFEVLHYNFQRGEIVPETLSAKEHWDQIQKGGGIDGFYQRYAQGLDGAEDKENTSEVVSTEVSDSSGRTS